MEQMTAVAIDEYGPPTTLVPRLLPLGRLPRGHVRLRTVAAAVNRADTELRSGRWSIDRPQPFPYVPGLEVVGRVVEVAGDVPTPPAIGGLATTMMMGMAGAFGERHGGYAEFVDVPANNLALLPGVADPVQVATAGLAGVTALRAIGRLGLPRHATVLVHGASGGVGAMAASILAAEGHEVWATVHNSHKRPVVAALGATKVLTTEQDALPPAYFDGVVETLGRRTFASSVASTRPGGTVCLVGAVTGPELDLMAWDLLAGRSLTGYSTETLTGPELRADMAALVELIAHGGLVLPPVTTYPLRHAARAHADMEAGHLVGRAVLVASDEPVPGSRSG